MVAPSQQRNTREDGSSPHPASSDRSLSIHYKMLYN
jgi:hypothetical protein